MYSAISSVVEMFSNTYVESVAMYTNKVEGKAENTGSTQSLPLSEAGGTGRADREFRDPIVRTANIAILDCWMLVLGRGKRTMLKWLEWTPH